MHARVCACMHVCLYVCMHEISHMYVCVCMYINTHTYVYELFSADVSMMYACPFVNILGLTKRYQKRANAL